MIDRPVTVVTGSRKGIGRYLTEHYLAKGHTVVGCSRKEPEETNTEHYIHYTMDVSDEKAVLSLFGDVSKRFGRVDNLINNAGVASMNHFLLTPQSVVERVFRDEMLVLKRENLSSITARKAGRIVNFSTVAVPLKLAGEAVYAASKAAIVSLTQVLAYELGDYGITVNAIGPTPIKTDLIANVPEKKLEPLIRSQAIKRYGEYRDVANAVDFFLKEESDFITGQILYLGGL